jgi:hypothetical protein
LLLGSSAVHLNQYRYALCRSLLLGEDIEIETTAEGATRIFSEGPEPGVLILEGDRSEPAVSRFLAWLGTLPENKLKNIQVLVMKKNPEDSDERSWYSWPFPCRIIRKPLNVREVRDVLTPFTNN